MNQLEFDSVELNFGNQVILNNIHVSCTVGKIVGILGRNGSGKSCLLRVVFGSLASENKSIRFNGNPLYGNYLKQKLIGYLPQRNLLPSFVSFREALNLYDVDFRKMEICFPELRMILRSKASSVSGGQRRLFEVLLLLFSHHPFCFFDEPFTGIMPIHVEKLVDIFKEQAANKGILITDHLHRTIRTICDELYVLVNGKTYRISNEEQLLKLGYLPSL
jgi:ABC-type multidrug transport system ATPase subunit